MHEVKCKKKEEGKWINNKNHELVKSYWECLAQYNVCEKLNLISRNSDGTNTLTDEEENLRARYVMELTMVNDIMSAEDTSMFANKQ